MAGSLGRRAVIGSGMAAAAVVGAATRAAGEGPAAAAAPVRAAVLEHLDQWTSALGLGELLRRAGVDVVPLDTSRPATEQGVDLVAFGSFTNNAAAYPAYVAAQTDSLRAFVEGGGVVLDLAQSDQLGNTTTYLPAPMTAINADPDHDAIHPFAPEHPLVRPLRRGTGGRVLTDRGSAIRTSWETLVEWHRMRVLLSCGSATTPAPPALLEGAHGRGRFLVSSLTVDKCFTAAGDAVQTPAGIGDSETFFAALAGYVASVRAGTAPDVVPTAMPTEPATGPMVGHVTTSEARIWLRPGRDHQHLQEWQCIVRGDRGPTRTAVTTISADNDHTMIFDVRGLRPDVRYRYTITPVEDAEAFTPLTGSFSTATPDDAPTVLTMGLGSCAPSAPNTVWDRIVAEGCDSFVMLGDTPYIDSTDLQFARTRHREFLQQPELARLVASMPVWATWDDHDFGGNDVAGDLAGKENTRTAFVDYRANPSYGHDAAGDQLRERTAGEGVYCSFRRGPVEVFMLDPRWFSRTAPSFADPSRTTCLGEVQWAWLQERLRASTAPFKLLASGMIWDDKTNSEKDDWETYAYEREAIYDFVRDQGISGVVLLSGDIHVSRALNYGEERVGYDLWQYIVSPLHDRTIPSLNVPNPALVHSAVEPHVFLKLVADTTVQPATLTATWINREGRQLFEVVRTSDDLTPAGRPGPPGPGGRGPRGPGRPGRPGPGPRGPRGPRPRPARP